MKTKIINKPRVGVVCSPWMGGSGVVASELGHVLQKRGWYIRYITFDKPFRIRNGSIKFSKVDTLDYPLFPHPMYQLPLTEKIITEVKKYKLGVIHCHYILPFGLAAIDAKKALANEGIEVKVVLTTHGSDVLKLSGIVPNITKYVLVEADVITSVSEDLAKKTRALVKTNVKVQVVPNFIDLNKFAPLKKRKQSREKILVHMSNFRPIKRVGDTIEAFKRINEVVPSKLVLIGDGPELGKIKELAELNGLSKKVIYKGKVKNPEKEIRKADLMLTTSEYESFCLANLEAMACGVPNCSYAVGGIPEVVEHGESGALSKYMDIYGVVNNAVDILNDSNWESYSNNARARAEKYSVDNIVPLYERLYGQLI